MDFLCRFLRIIGFCFCLIVLLIPRRMFLLPLCSEGMISRDSIRIPWIIPWSLPIIECVAITNRCLRQSDYRTLGRSEPYNPHIALKLSAVQIISDCTDRSLPDRQIVRDCKSKPCILCIIVLKCYEYTCIIFRLWRSSGHRDGGMIVFGFIFTDIQAFNACFNSEGIQCCSLTALIQRNRKTEVVIIVPAGCRLPQNIWWYVQANSAGWIG